MCEAAAQLSSFFCHEAGVHKEGFIAFGGMEDVRFRGQVKPGDRLVLVAKAIRLHRRHTMFDCQGFVGTNMAMVHRFARAREAGRHRRLLPVQNEPVRRGKP